MFYRLLIRFVSSINTNFVHKFAYLYTYSLCRLCRFIPISLSLPLNPVDVIGLHFPNPVGLAAGFDRNGKLLCCSEPSGFGFIEIGTVNVDAQIEADDKILNVVKNLEKAAGKYQNKNRQQQWGVNLGSLENTVSDRTIADYVQGMQLFWSHADYFVINLSRPDSPARVLNPDMEKLYELLQNIKQQHGRLTEKKGKSIPVVIKTAVDYINNEHINNVLLLAKDCGIDGAILAFEAWPDIHAVCERVRLFAEQIESFPFIVVGGIRSAKDANRVLNAGASLVQIYTGLVQDGPLQTRKMIDSLGGLTGERDVAP